MPTIEENQTIWGKDYTWPQRGDEWSGPWGTVAAQWFCTILPRIHRFVPCETILEIAPGYGRWTAHLKDLCKSLIAVDLNASCIEACKIRFLDLPHVSCYKNDGYSLEMVPDASIDFAFSFDSLVRAEADVILH